MHALISEELIVNMFSLHDKEHMKRLGSEWWNLRKVMRPQPIEKIRNYFGDSIGLYFSFVGKHAFPALGKNIPYSRKHWNFAEFYSYALVVPTLLGFLQFVFGGERTIFFCCFYVVWSVIFLEAWKRKSSKLAYGWGTLSLTNMETPRPDYYGKLGRDAITGKMTPQYPIWKTMCQVYLVSVPVILCCIVAAGFMTIGQFSLEDYFVEQFGYESYITFVPSVFQSALVAILTIFYDRFSTYLTIKENHRTQSQFERYRVNKLIVLEFVNNFFSLFYLAFVKQGKG